MFVLFCLFRSKKEAFQVLSEFDFFCLRERVIYLNLNSKESCDQGFRFSDDDDEKEWCTESVVLFFFFFFF